MIKADDEQCRRLRQMIKEEMDIHGIIPLIDQVFVFHGENDKNEKDDEQRAMATNPLKNRGVRTSAVSHSKTNLHDKKKIVHYYRKKFTPQNFGPPQLSKGRR